MTTVKEEVKVQPKPTRNKRVPFGVPQTKLSVNNTIDGFHLHWVNDENSRLFQAEQGGYQFVDPSEVGVAGERESRVKVLVGSNADGSPMFAYLMKIPMEYYLEDQQILQGQLDQIDKAIRSGKFDEKAGDARYVPKEGISYK